jgi:asparagine synthase (glutamine-hydrolysing)
VSGLAGVVNLDGAPVDQPALARMTQSLTFAGPDNHSIWIDGAAGFGHTLLKTTDESVFEQQPYTLDGKVWVVADARIDARRDLLAKLKAGGQDARRDATDVELIARAYSVWQEDCVDHLLGDFAFGIWDKPLRRLFCGRDHLGAKPCYYASLGKTVVFSNSLDTVRLYPGVSGRLNDLAVADFLLFNINWDGARTIFADIGRLPPAHTATWSAGGMHSRQYWKLPVDEPIFYPKDDDYLDHFKESLQEAVADRLRTSRISLFMSGGLDSTTLAATAKRLLRVRGEDSGLHAFTIVHDRDDQERAHARFAAENLGIPIEFQYWDPKQFNVEWHQTAFHTPEPVPYPTDLPWECANHQRMASWSRVAFYGEGPDNALLFEWRPYLSYLMRKKRLGRLFYDLYFQTVLHGRLPLPSFSWRQESSERNREDFPDWLQPDFEKRMELRSRWEEIRMQKSAPHPIRPVGYSSFSHPLWQAMFERYQPEYTKAQLEVRHPFLDVRLLRFLLAIPSLPWCRHKYLLRRAMRGSLPDEVLARPKTPLVHDVWGTHMRKLGLPPATMTPALEEYVAQGRLLQSPSDPAHFWMDFRVRSIDYWLRNMNLP